MAVREGRRPPARRKSRQFDILLLPQVKTYGHIVSFRNLEQATNDALALFGNKGAQGIALLKPYAGYYAEYQQKIAELVALFPLGTAITARPRGKPS
ncbi:MAG: hypothetical protein LBH31_08895 [Burkholderiaceae bacterium]|jgi:type I restriction enzyme R subunit|nr:hypothetical protein [Burkholderiaceae bacterium]